MDEPLVDVSMYHLNGWRRSRADLAPNHLILDEVVSDYADGGLTFDIGYSDSTRLADSGERGVDMTPRMLYVNGFRGSVQLLWL